MRDALIDLKKQVLDNYNPIKVSEKAMTILLNYSNEIPYKFQSDLHGLIAMDMGDELYEIVIKWWRKYRTINSNNEQIK